jgi:hypothetical protein
MIMLCSLDMAVDLDILESKLASLLRPLDPDLTVLPWYVDLLKALVAAAWVVDGAALLYLLTMILIVFPGMEGMMAEAAY